MNQHAANVGTVLEIVKAVEADEYVYAESLIASMGVPLCMSTALELVNHMTKLLAEQAGISHAEYLDTMRVWVMAAP